MQKYLVPELSIDLTPLNLLKKMVDDGLLGIKAGKGFYEWTEERIKDVINRRDSGLLELIKIRNRL